MRIRSRNHESFKAAMYNLLVAGGVLAFVAVCFILGPFVRPLLWAFLMGAVLFPFKRRLAQLLNGWFEKLEERDSHIALGICLAPIEATESCGHLLIDWLKEHWQPLTVGSGIAVTSKLLMLYAPKGFLYSIWQTIIYSHYLLVNFMSYFNVFFVSHGNELKTHSFLSISVNLFRFVDFNRNCGLRQHRSLYLVSYEW